MNDLPELLPEGGPETQELAGEGHLTVGQWYWVLPASDQVHEGDVPEGSWLGCTMRLGSNYAMLESPHTGSQSYHRERVHFDEAWKRLRHEPNADSIIRGYVSDFQAKSQALLDEVRAVTARLGVVPQQQIAQEGAGGQLAVLSAQVDTKAYETALVEAKNKTLPDLFKEMKATNDELVRWMAAPALPMMADIAPMKALVGAIEDRIFTISLYAGLTEEAVQCCEGDAAGMGERLHVMQRRLYMDEECIAAYRAGGIQLKSIDEFDAWISEPENRDRLLPFPRTVAAFRVRRTELEREDYGNALAAFVNAQISQAEKHTYLYVRNGAQVWRLDCQFLFPELIFPSESGLGVEPMMVKASGSRIDAFMPLREYEDRLRTKAEREAKLAAWAADNPDKRPDRDAPHELRWGHDELNASSWQPFDPSSVYYDDASEAMADELKRQNRLAVIIQGLFDRSPVLHPHPPVQTWTPHGFERAIKLVYDGDGLTHGDPPDFLAYQRRLNFAIGPDSILTGQDDVWAKQQAVRENERQRNDYRTNRNAAHYKRFRPYGNPGPGVVGRPDQWQPKARKAVFRWTTQTDNWARGGYTERRHAVSVPVDQLLNVSAYKLGDFRQFFADPRTRAEYFKWAPLLLAAEDYHASLGAADAP